MNHDDIGHDGICMYCGALVPCDDIECIAPAGHESLCCDCMIKERNRPDPFDIACERRYDGSDIG
jgi:hypothetical protein